MPGYVVLQSGKAETPHGGVALFSNAFLPGQHQASIIKADAVEAIANIRPLGTLAAQRRRLDFVAGFDRDFLAEADRDPTIEAAIHNAETAFRMQSEVPELCDISGETEATKEAATGSMSHPIAQPITAASACWPGVWWSVACGSSN